MPSCPRCGENIPSGSKYCPRCGYNREKAHFSDSGLDNLRHNYRAQTLWISRFIAYIIDSVITGIFSVLGWILIIVPFLLGSIFTGTWWNWRNILGYPLTFGLFQLAYFTITEGWYGASIGKQIMGLRVTTVNGDKPSYANSFIRNLSKIHGGLLLLDLLFGLILLKEPTKKFTDRISGTVVAKAGGISLEPFYDLGRTINKNVDYNGGYRWNEKVEGSDVISGIGFGVFLIVLAAIFIVFPSIPSVFIDWITRIGEGGQIIPPKALLEPLAWFMGSMGCWGIISGILKMSMKKRPISSIDDIYGGLFSITLAYILWQFITGAIAWGVLWPMFIIAVGGLILLSALTHYLIT